MKTKPQQENSMKNHNETASPLINQDDDDQARQQEIRAQIKQLEADRVAADDDSRLPAENVAEQDKIDAQISSLDRQLAMYAGRSKKRLAPLLDSLKGMKVDHRDSEHKFRNVRLQLANDTIGKEAEQIQHFKDLLLAIVWLRDSSDDNYIDALKNMLDGAGYFERDETIEAAKKLGLYLEAPEQPGELAKSEDILMRELGTGWTHQSDDWQQRHIYNQTPDTKIQTHTSAVTEHEGNPERRQGAQYLDLSDRA